MQTELVDMLDDLKQDIDDTTVYMYDTHFNAAQLEEVEALFFEMHDKLTAIRYYTRQAEKK